MISEHLVALGPFIAPVLVLLLALAAGLAWWLIDTGIRQKSAARLAVGVPLSGYLVAVATSGVLS
jgi:hypothetical protein